MKGFYDQGIFTVSFLINDQDVLKGLLTTAMIYAVTYLIVKLYLKGRISKVDE